MRNSALSAARPKNCFDDRADWVLYFADFLRLFDEKVSL